MSDWKIRRLDEYVANGAIILGRGNIISKDDINAHPGPYPIYSSSAHNNGKFGEYAKFMFNEELVTWSVDGGGSLFYRPKHKFSVTNVCGFMRIKAPYLDALFIYYSLSNQHKYMTFDYTSKAHPSVIKKLYWLPDIDLKIQQKIANILAVIDETMKKTEEIIKKYQQVKTGLMQDLFTRGIGPDGMLRPPREQAPELYHETKIGWIPKDWQATKLKDILLRTGGYLQTGPFGSQLHAHEYTYEGVPVVMPQDINNGLVHQDQIARITEHRANTLIRHRLKVGDIIIARRGELSRSAAITEFEKGWVCGTGCFLMRLGHTKLNSKFLSHAYRHSIIQRQVEGLAVGSTMPSLNNGIMGNLIFPDIAPSEQTAISEKIQISEEKITTLQAEKTKLKFLKSGLMQDLLTGKKTDSLDAAESPCV